MKMYESHIYFIRTGKTRRVHRRLLIFPQQTKSAELLPHGYLIVSSILPPFG